MKSNTGHKESKTNPWESSSDNNLITGGAYEHHNDTNTKDKNFENIVTNPQVETHKKKMEEEALSQKQTKQKALKKDVLHTLIEDDINQIVIDRELFEKVAS